MLSTTLETTLRRALLIAAERRHELATLEHLLMALTEDEDAVRVLEGCGIDFRRLRSDLSDFLDDGLTALVVEEPVQPTPTFGFQRVVQRAASEKGRGPRDEITGAEILATIFSEPESRAVFFLLEQGMEQRDAERFISRGITKKPGLDRS